MAPQTDFFMTGGRMSTTNIPAIDTIISAAESEGARVGLCAILPDGTRIGHREDEIFVAASTIKIAIMIQLYRMVDAGESDLGQIHEMQESDISAGSGVMQGLHPGVSLTLKDICYLMMSISDNTATNILIEHCGRENINATMRELGLKDSYLARPMRGAPAPEGERENVATPAEFALIIETILNGTAASAESCMAMLEVLKTQANSRRIGRYVPKDMEWGSKTGSHVTTVNDVGFIMTKDGPLIVSVYGELFADVVTGEIFISEITRELLVADL